MERLAHALSHGFPVSIRYSRIMTTYFQQLNIDTQPGISLHNITPAVKEAVRASGIPEGILVVTSQHTTVAITLNEDEQRLAIDIREHFEKLVPPDRPYLHNDIHLRDCDPEEPENAHSHLIAMLLGGSESLAVHKGRLQLGKWQSLLVAELDGPRRRSVTLQIVGE